MGDINAEIMKRASQETELYIDLVTNITMAMLTGAVNRFTQETILLTVDTAAQVASRITQLGIDVFNERMDFWIQEATRQGEEPQEPTPTDEPGAPQKEWEAAIGQSAKVSKVLNEGKEHPKPKTELNQQLRKMIEDQVKRSKPAPKTVRE